MSIQKLNILSALVIAKEIEEVCLFSVASRTKHATFCKYVNSVCFEKKKKKLGDLYKIQCTGCVHTIDGAPSGATALD